ncbi:Uncharacterised protein [Raoultella terrigena]|uniref:Uncharacterized protein n=1 Tax=Raoultella terrigena TaxID=577 RepID=A0A4U9CWW1_RAOTE|nr:Uncharacterised protein [Raoultella terrigena]
MSRCVRLNVQRTAFDVHLGKFCLQGFQQLPVSGGSSAVQQPALRQQHRTAANGCNAAGMGSGKAQPVDHRNAFLRVLTSAGDNDGIEWLARVYLMQAVICQ